MSTKQLMTAANIHKYVNHLWKLKTFTPHEITFDSKLLNYHYVATQKEKVGSYSTYRGTLQTSKKSKTQSEGSST